MSCGELLGPSLDGLVPGSELRQPHWCAKSSAVPRKRRPEDDQRLEPQRVKISFRPKKNERLGRKGERCGMRLSDAKEVKRTGEAMERDVNRCKNPCKSHAKPMKKHHVWGRFSTEIHETVRVSSSFGLRGSTSVASGCKWRAASRRTSSVVAVAATMRRMTTSIFTRPSRFTSKTSHLSAFGACKTAGEGERGVQVACRKGARC